MIRLKRVILHSDLDAARHKVEGPPAKPQAHSGGARRDDRAEVAIRRMATLDQRMHALRGASVETLTRYPEQDDVTAA